MKTLAVVLIGFYVLVAVAVGAFLVLMADTVEVCEGAKSELIGSAQLVHESVTGTNGATSMELVYLVLDLGVDDANDAIGEQRRRLERAGWDVDDTDFGVSAVSDRWDAVAHVSPLTRYLARPELLMNDSGDAQVARNRLPRRDALILVDVEPRSYDSPCSWLLL